MCSGSRAGRSLLAALMLTVATPALAQPMRIAAERGEMTAGLTLTWTAPVTVEHAQDGRELTLRFSRPIGTARVETIAERLEGWVENVQYGYDSMLLVLAPGVTVDVNPNRTGVRLSFETEPHALSTPPEESRAADRRLAYLRAVTLLEDGEVAEARRHIDAMLAAEPKDRDAVELLAQVAERQGRWREAVALYDRSLGLSPDGETATDARRRLLREYGDHARLDVDYVRVERADTQRVARLTGKQEVGWDTAFRYVVENRRLDVDQARRADGRLAPFHGQRTRGELSLLHDWESMDQSRASLFVAPGTLGAGIGHDLRGGDGRTRLSLAWREPTYTFVEGIIGAGRRDRLWAAREQRLSERWFATLGGGLNRYGLGAQGDLARSAGVEGSLRYTFVTQRPVASVAYVLDGEYVGRRVTRTDAAGVAFVPLPVVTREVHSLQLAVEDNYAGGFRYAAQAGWSFDRFNRGGPFAAALLGYEVVDGLEAGVRASHTVSTARGTGSAANTVGGYLLWRY